MTPNTQTVRITTEALEEKPLPAVVYERGLRDCELLRGQRLSQRGGRLEVVVHFLLAQLVDLFTLLPIIVHVEVPVVKSYTHTARSGGVAVQVASVDPDGGAFDFVSADAPWR